ncbi:phage terminase large subunit [uncultured Clostridium sp.]|uniref:phage terminase large subunit n=1 Tax=uncultured Clostridium sp. TaxID=59620 RepID=UPI0025CDC4B2|nr:phage terminase large subunit [uncultured Clostridium sp.]
MLTESEVLELEELLRLRDRDHATEDLISFTKWTFPNYEVSEHHRRYAKALDDFSVGKIKNLMVFMPPQHGKSELCSRRLPAKLLGDNPELRIALASYNHSFASKFNRDVQRIVDSNEYKEIYLKTRLASKGFKTDGSWLRNSEEFEIVNHRGSFITVGVGGGLTGRLVDIGIIDDPYKDAADAWSPTVRQNVQDWYDTVFKTRLHNDSQQLITLTRWHQDDLAGTILKREPKNWKVVVFPAIKIGPPTEEDPREEGEALWESKHSLERLLAIKKQNSHVFESLYQQNPKPAEGLLFSTESLKRFKLSDIKNMKRDGVVAAIDVADKGEDFYCMLIGEIINKKIYIVDCIFTQEPVEKTEPLTIAMLDKYRPNKCRIESNGAGEMYCRNLKKQCRKQGFLTSFDPVFSTINKETRILLASGQIKENLYFRSDYSHNSQYSKFMDNLTGYTLQGKNEHDDAPDTATALIDMLQKSSLGRRTGVR